MRSPPPKGAAMTTTRGPVPLDRLREIARMKLLHHQPHVTAASSCPTTTSNTTTLSASASSWIAPHNTHLDGGLTRFQRGGAITTPSKSPVLALDLSVRGDAAAVDPPPKRRGPSQRGTPQRGGRTQQQGVAVGSPVEGGQQRSQRAATTGGTRRRGNASSSSSLQGGTRSATTPRRSAGADAQGTPGRGPRLSVASPSGRADGRRRQSSPTLHQVLQKGAEHFLGEEWREETDQHRIPQTEAEILHNLRLSELEESGAASGRSSRRHSRRTSLSKEGSSSFVHGSMDSQGPNASKMTMAQRARIRATLEKHQFEEDTVQSQLEKLDEQLRATRDKWKHVRGDVGPSRQGSRSPSPRARSGPSGGVRSSTPVRSRTPSRRQTPVASRRGSVDIVVADLSSSPSRRGSRPTSRQRTPVVSQSVSRRTSPSGSRPASRRGTPTPSQRGTPVASRRGSVQGTPQGSRRGSCQASPRSSRAVSPRRAVIPPQEQRSHSQGRQGGSRGGDNNRRMSASTPVSPRRKTTSQKHRGLADGGMPGAGRQHRRRHSLDAGGTSLRGSPDRASSPAACRSPRRDGSFTPPLRGASGGRETLNLPAPKMTGTRRRSGTFTKSMLSQDGADNEEVRTRISDEELKQALRLTGLPASAPAPAGRRSASVPVRSRPGTASPPPTRAGGQPLKGIPHHTASRAAAKQQQALERQQRLREQQQHQQAGHKKPRRSMSAPRDRGRTVFPGNSTREDDAVHPSKRTLSSAADTSSSGIHSRSVRASPEKRPKLTHTPEGPGRKFRRRRFTNLSTLGGNQKASTRASGDKDDETLVAVPWSPSGFHKALPGGSGPMQPFSSSAGVPIEAVSSSAPVSVDVALPHLLIHSEEIQRVLMDMEQTEKAIQFEKYEMERRRLERVNNQMHFPAGATEPAFTYTNPTPRSRLLQSSRLGSSFQQQSDQHTLASHRLQAGAEDLLHSSVVAPSRPTESRVDLESLARQENAIESLLRLEQQSDILQRNLKLHQRILDAYRSGRANRIAHRLKTSAVLGTSSPRDRHVPHASASPSSGHLSAGRGVPSPSKGGAVQVSRGDLSMAELIAQMPVADVAASLRELHDMTLHFSSSAPQSTSVPSTTGGPQVRVEEMEKKLATTFRMLEDLQLQANILKSRFSGQQQALQSTHEQVLMSEQQDLAPPVGVASVPSRNGPGGAETGGGAPGAGAGAGAGRISGTESRGASGEGTDATSVPSKSMVSVADDVTDARHQLALLLETPLPSALRQSRAEFPGSSGGSAESLQHSHSHIVLQGQPEDWRDPAASEHRHDERLEYGVGGGAAGHSIDGDLKGSRSGGGVGDDGDADDDVHQEARLRLRLQELQQLQQERDLQHRKGFHSATSEGPPPHREVHQSRVERENPNEGQVVSSNQGHAEANKSTPADISGSVFPVSASTLSTQSARFQDFHLPGSPSQFAVTVQEQTFAHRLLHEGEEQGNGQEGLSDGSSLGTAPATAMNPRKSVSEEALERSQKVMERIQKRSNARSADELVEKVLELPAVSGGMREGPSSEAQAAEQPRRGRQPSSPAGVSTPVTGVGDDSILSDISDLSSDEEDATTSMASPALVVTAKKRIYSSQGTESVGGGERKAQEQEQEEVEMVVSTKVLQEKVLEPRAERESGADGQMEEGEGISAPLSEQEQRQRERSQRAEEVRRTIQLRREQLRKEQELKAAETEEDPQGRTGSQLPATEGVASRLQSALQEKLQRQGGGEHSGQASQHMATAPPSTISLKARSTFYEGGEPVSSSSSSLVQSVMSQHFSGRGPSPPTTITQPSKEE